MRTEWQDPKTGLIWAVEPEDRLYTYNEAMKKEWSNDWRVPTINELISLLDHNKSYPSCSAPLIFNKHHYWFWSVSPSVGYPTFALGVSFFYNGDVLSVSRVNNGCVRLVRGEMKE